jgi:hypothetical protein
MTADNVALVTQMRAGTHYMCAALRFALEATLMRPRDGGKYGPMDDADILADMHPDSRFALPPPRPGRHIYFSHYYHPHHRALGTMPRISLIGFPLDSFYSDGVVYSDKQYSAGPSDIRAHAKDYVFRHDSEEWKFLEERMHQNARWLTEIGNSTDDLVVRYEDMAQDFMGTSARIDRHLGGLATPLPAPVVSRKRTYWTRDFASRFDPQAWRELKKIFGSSIARFYPECVSELERT